MRDLNKKNQFLCNKALEIRLSILDIMFSAQSSHIGSALSIVEIMTIIYHEFINIDLIQKGSRNRDYFILSKGHAAAALYATLASIGVINANNLKTYYKNGSNLAGHPIRDCACGVEASTGSLGHGLSMAVGIALSCKRDGLKNKIYVLLGDGECQEGSVWEAVMIAVRLKLNNLIMIVDSNKLQGFDRTEDIEGSSLKQKFEGFGCNCFEVDGHDFVALRTVIECSGKVELPDVIIANTIKGKGISFMQNKLEWHYKSLNSELYESAKKELINF